jgi:phosphoserine phosphatase
MGSIKLQVEPIVNKAKNCLQMFWNKQFKKEKLQLLEKARQIALEDSMVAGDSYK